MIMLIYTRFKRFIPHASGTSVDCFAMLSVSLAGARLAAAASAADGKRYAAGETRGRALHRYAPLRPAADAGPR